jgi:hypothetical protein
MLGHGVGGVHSGRREEKEEEHEKKNKKNEQDESLFPPFYSLVNLVSEVHSWEHRARLYYKPKSCAEKRLVGTGNF